MEAGKGRRQDHANPTATGRTKVLRYEYHPAYEHYPPPLQSCATSTRHSSTVHGWTRLHGAPPMVRTALSCVYRSNCGIPGPVGIR